MKRLLEQADAFEFMARLPSSSVDIVCTDPAYCSLEKHRKGTTARLTVSKQSSNKWFPVIPNWKLRGVVAESHRVLRPGKHMYLFCDDESSDIVMDEVRANKFAYQKRIVWDKKTIGMGYNWRNQYEFVVYAVKGPLSAKQRLADLSESDVQAFDRVRGGYPTEKPKQLLSKLLSMSGGPGDLVLDPFSGSGNCVSAAIELGMNVAACDIQESAYYATRHAAFQADRRIQRLARAA